MSSEFRLIATYPVRVHRMSTVPALRCGNCDALFTESGDPKWECTSCGCEQVSEENRCEQCHRFMAKVCDATCPACEGESDEFSEVEAWSGADGDLYESESAYHEWMDTAPVRAESKRKADEQWAQMYAEHKAAARVVNERVLPKAVTLLSCPGWEHAPELRHNIEWAVENMERDIEDTSGWQSTLWLREVYPLLCADHDPSLVKALLDHELDYDYGDRVAAAVRKEVTMRITHPKLLERMDRHWSKGCGIGVATIDVIEGLLDAMAKR